MPRVSWHNFTGGLVTTTLSSRYDLQKFGTFLQACTNAIPNIHGDIERRPGMEYIATLDSCAYLLPFQFSSEPDQNYLLVFTPDNICVYNQNLGCFESNASCCVTACTCTCTYSHYYGSSSLVNIPVGASVIICMSGGGGGAGDYGAWGYACTCTAGGNGELLICSFVNQYSTWCFLLGCGGCGVPFSIYCSILGYGGGGGGGSVFRSSDCKCVFIARGGGGGAGYTSLYGGSGGAYGGGANGYSCVGLADSTLGGGCGGCGGGYPAGQCCSAYGQGYAGGCEGGYSQCRPAQGGSGACGSSRSEVAGCPGWLCINYTYTC